VSIIDVIQTHRLSRTVFLWTAGQSLANSGGPVFASESLELLEVASVPLEPGSLAVGADYFPIFALS